MSLSDSKGHYNAIDMVSRKHLSPSSVDGHLHDGCEMKNDDAAWAATNMGPLDPANTSRGYFESHDSAKNYQFAVNASWVVNWFLLGKHFLRLLTRSNTTPWS
jgi:hypothetical protein